VTVPRLGFFSLVASLALASLTGCGRDAKRTPADLILANGTVHTLANPPVAATAVAVSGDRIVYVGDDTGASAWRGERTRWVDLGGKTVLPGLVDAHGHLAI
jgi:predicted amidohydrolase YtcJ